MLRHMAASGILAVVSQFTYRPYSYENPLTFGGWLDGKVQVLRVGDSLHSGDSFLGTGLDVSQSFISRLMFYMLWPCGKNNDKCDGD